MYKFGYVAILGKPNAGKSTLINYLVGMKLAIVSQKPQTTRDNILGIYTSKNSQLVFIDTPGIHKATSHLDKFMMKNVRTAKAGADVVLYLLDSSVAPDPDEIEHIEKMKADGINLIVAGSKLDKKKVDFDCDVCFSALTGENIPLLIEKILKFIPSSKTKNFLYDADEVTDKPVKFIISEYIRESALKQLKKEIPHGIAVVVTKFEETSKIANIEAEIVCEKPNHKGIIIGKGGATLKAIGIESRANAEQLLGKKVMLSLFVKVEEGWKDKPNKLTGLGYN
ncbi:MAG TPA: GTPase Era [Clostridiales bacterium]|nr:GTPase Era [Clostridiales bacterium]